MWCANPYVVRRRPGRAPLEGHHGNRQSGRISLDDLDLQLGMRANRQQQAEQQRENGCGLHSGQLHFVSHHHK